MGRNHHVHRIIWFLVNGAWPKMHIDHIDGDKHNNRLSNLREASRSENNWNKGIYKSNTSGYKGVCFNTKSGRWQAQIKKHGVRKYLGLFDTPEAAADAYWIAAKEMHGEFARHS